MAKAVKKDARKGQESVARGGTSTSNTRESRAAAGAKPTSTRRTKHSCAKKRTMGDFIFPVIQSVAGSTTSGGTSGAMTSRTIVTRARAASSSFASMSKGAVCFSDPNPYGPLGESADEAPALAPALAPTPRQSKRNKFPYLTDANTSTANVASSNKRARTFEALTHSRSPSPSQQRVKTPKITNKDASAAEPLSPHKTRAVTARDQRTDAAATDEVVRNPAVVAAATDEVVRNPAVDAAVATLSPKNTAEPRRSDRIRAAAARAPEVALDAVHDPDPAAVVATGISSEAAVDPGPRRSGRNRVPAVAATRSNRDAIAVAAPRGNAATTVAPRNTRAKLLESGRVTRDMMDALLTARDLKRPSTPVPDAAEVAAQRAADDALNTDADRFLAASLKRYTVGPPVTYDAAVKDILAEYQVVVTQWNAEPVNSTPKPEKLQKRKLNTREQGGINLMDPRWRGVARAHLEYGVPPPHSFPFQQWAHLDDAFTALANDIPDMVTLRQMGTHLGVFVTDGTFSLHGSFRLSVANPEFCLATRDALPCVQWRKFQGVELVKTSPNGAKCPYYTLHSTTLFKECNGMFYPNRSTSTSGYTTGGKKRLPKTWLGVSRRAVLLGLAATPGFEDGELAGDGSNSRRDEISIAHIDVTQRELEFILELKAQPLRRHGTTGKLLYGGFPFAWIGKTRGIACTEAALTAAGHHAVGSSVCRSATVRYVDLIKSLPARPSIFSRAYPHKLEHLSDLNHRAPSCRKAVERTWDILAIAKMRLIEGLTTQQLTDRLRKERDQESLQTDQVQRMLLTPIDDVTSTNLPGVGLWPSPVEKQGGVGSRLSHRIDIIRAVNKAILKPVRDAGAAKIARFKKVYGAALEYDCFLIDWDTLTAIVPIGMVNDCETATFYTPDEQSAQLAYASRQPRYNPCVAPPADVLLDALRKRSPAVVLSAVMEFIGDGSEWERRERAERLTQPTKGSEYFHKATGFTTIDLCTAQVYHANVLKFRGVGIKCAKDIGTGKALFYDDEGWSTSGGQRPRQSAEFRYVSILKERANTDAGAAAEDAEAAQASRSAHSHPGGDFGLGQDEGSGVF